ncbi:MAG: kynureninase [Acidobacteria bacterium]|nr:kynureninase [Acidobacteriota bacterium]
MLNPADLAPHYSRFRVTERILLSGHSHQAWPDVSLAAQEQAWLDAAEHLDHKWEQAFAQASRVRRGFAALLGEPDAEIALGANTHELVVRFLSALPLGTRSRLVTTNGEFHTIRRQLDRLGEAGIIIDKVDAHPVDTLAERLAARVQDDVAAVLVSSVLFETSEIVPHLSHVAAACARHGAELLVDAYHHLNVVPFDVEAFGLSRAFIVGGGYKYCQLGEGNCFLRVPPDCTLRPVITGWFAEFAALEHGERAGRVGYGTGASRFAGATYDPASHYRAAAVFDVHRQQQMTPVPLRALNQAQTRAIVREFAAGDVDPVRAAVVPMPAERRAGFVAIRMADAVSMAARLNAVGVWCDARGSSLRLGPAPYVTFDQLSAGVAALLDLLQKPPTDPVG